MWSYIKSFFNYFFSYESEDEIDYEAEYYLSEQILELELQAEATEGALLQPTSHIPRTAACYQRTGVITFLEEDTVLIDGMIYFDAKACNLNLQVSDKVSYLCYKNEHDTIVIVRILENLGVHWGDNEDAIDERPFDVTEHVFVGEVDYRKNRTVFIKDADFKFDLDSVSSTFIPIKGDWLELRCKVRFDEENPMDITFDTIIEVLSLNPLRTKVKSGVVTEWNEDTGICDRQIFFNKYCIVNHGPLTVGSKVLIEAIESNQGAYLWRALKIEVIEIVNISQIKQETTAFNSIEEKSLELEKKNNIEVTYPLKFESANFEENSITMNITNYNDEPVVVNKWIILCKKRDSQVNINPFLIKPKKIYPRHTFSLTITCQPKFFGRSKEHLVILFRGFQVDRLIEINVTSNKILGDNRAQEQVYITRREQIALTKEMRQNGYKTVIPGAKLVRTPNFIATNLGQYKIPNTIWDTVLGYSNETINHLDYNTIISRIETRLPCLIQTLNIHNYTDRWHTLIHMEEIQTNIGMRSYDIQQGFLIRCQEYLGIEIKGLSEKRPSLIVGDRVIVNDKWDKSLPSYEGFVHLIKGDLVLVKFNPQFHEVYSGSDVSVSFHFNRTIFRRAHHAVNLAISNLGADILFPNRINTRPFQIPKEKIDTVEWYNKYLNAGQKEAIKNILLGECRPLPYCIYGPPGTGKTITIIETILQILNLMPDSRILVATPSNSAANLVTERLVQYRKWFSSSIVRLIANYMVDNENISDIIKPYCATINIAREDTVKSSHEVKNGFNLNVSASYIARHRVCIGTCYSIGTMFHLAMPKGHFTHVIVDEAGQALEPEIMIPLTFIDKENGQIILAGDPMQLGPIAMSKYCLEFDYNESYLSRLLETFPYLRDYNTYENGYNGKLVTRLSENYRSLEEVITLPSKMFYDSSLVPKLQRNMPWVGKLLDVISEVFETTENPKTGGIFVHGVKGCNRRAKDSPSWFNPEEAATLALTVCKLVKKNIPVDEIGVVTPYIAQIKYIRRLFDALGLPRPKIGTVEEFQGQERAIIIISTVRTTESEVAMDQKHALGFVKNPKRLNVALTRAQVAVLLFCDPHLLLTDPLWQQVINHAIQSNKYMGCDLPINCDNRKVDLNIQE